MHLVERLKHLVHNNIVSVLLSRLEWNYADLNVSNALIVILLIFLFKNYRYDINVTLNDINIIR